MWILDKALEDYLHLFTPQRLWIMDRNFPGVPRISRMLAAGTHVLIRVRDGITLERIGDFLPDGSYLAAISGGGITLTVRVIEYTVSVAGREAPELFCLVSDLHDHDAYPAGVLGAAYHWRWIGSETSLKEAKSAISGAGPSTGAMLRSQSPALIAQEHAAWVTATGLARATARAAAAVAVPAGKGKRAGQPVHPRQISFTAARRTIVTTTRTGAATASLPAPAITAGRVRVLAGLARRRVDVDRHRHRERKTKARLGFPSGGPHIPGPCFLGAFGRRPGRSGCPSVLVFSPLVAVLPGILPLLTERVGVAVVRVFRGAVGLAGQRPRSEADKPHEAADPEDHHRH